jgi:sugar phosphate isomerase/epimerase
VNRRDFLAIVPGAAALAVTRRAHAGHLIPESLLGIQLYTLRGLMERDVASTLKTVARIGYRKVEFAGYFGLEHSEVRDLLASNNLMSPSTHATLGLLREDVDGWIEACNAVGHDYLVCSWMSPDQHRSLDSWRGIVHELNHFGEKCRDAGIQFAYHNHDFEFETLDGTRPYDLILGETDPSLVKLELDWFWTAFARVDTKALMRANPDRYKLFHVKDMNVQREMTDPGQGTLPFSDLLALAGEIGGEHLYVERDNPVDPLQTARQGFEHITSLLG